MVFKCRFNLIKSSKNPHVIMRFCFCLLTLHSLRKPSSTWNDFYLDYSRFQRNKTLKHLSASHHFPSKMPCRFPWHFKFNFNLKGLKWLSSLICFFSPPFSLFFIYILSLPWLNFYLFRNNDSLKARNFTPLLKMFGDDEN